MSGTTAALGKLIEAGLLSRGDTIRQSPARGGSGPGFFGHPALDKAVPAGLGRSLHMIEAAGTVGDAAAAGFIVSVLIKLCSARRPAVWISHGLAEGEEGRLHGPGLCDLAMDPAALVLVRARRPRDVLWAMEEALRSAAVSAVVGEVRNADPGLTATRRLALRSEHGGVPAYLLLAGQGAEGAIAARTRWRISSARGHSAHGLLGPPAWNIELKKNKEGSSGRFTVGFDPENGRFFEIEGSASEAAPSPRAPREGVSRVLPFPGPSGRSGSGRA